MATTENDELVLVVSAESELASGLALAERMAAQSGFAVTCALVAEQSSNLKASNLKGLLEAKVAASDFLSKHEFHIATLENGTDGLLQFLESEPELRIVLLPTLDNLGVTAKELLARVHAMVCCFAPHICWEQPPNRILSVGDDGDEAVRWFCEHLVPHPKIESVDIEQLQSQPDQLTQGDLLVIGTQPQRLDASTKLAKHTMDSLPGPVAIVRGERSWYEWFWQRYAHQMVAKYIPQMERARRRELSEELQQFSKLDFEFISLICASTFLASFGLLQNSAAVIIGAMLVAPLMTPILGAGLSLAHGNRPLFYQSLKTISLGFCAALLTSSFFGLLVRFIAPSILAHDAQDRLIFTEEMWSRTHPTSIDFLVGLVGGSAAAFARTRGHLADALAGAAIAAALVPPIATAGLHIAFYFLPISPPDNPDDLNNLVYAPVVLFVANMLTIMLGSSFVLWACGIRGEHTHSPRGRRAPPANRP